MSRQTIGQLCKDSRVAKGLSQDDAAKLTHYARRSVSDFERDRRTEQVFGYACRLAQALDDMSLLRKVVAIEVGVPVAGRPVPEGVDRHVACLRDLAIKEKRQAIEVLSEVPFWQLGPGQKDAAERAAIAILGAIDAFSWTYDALCAAAGLDPDELMNKRPCMVA